MLYTWHVVTEAKELLPLLPLKPSFASTEKLLKDKSAGRHGSEGGGGAEKRTPLASW